MVARKHLIDTIADLASAAANPKANLKDGQQITVAGYYAAGDGGGGPFTWDAASTATANGGTVLAHDDGGTGRFLRQGDGSTFNVLEWGIVPNVDHSTRWQALLNAIPETARGYGTTGGYSAASYKIKVPSQTTAYIINTQVVIPQNANVSIESAGAGWGPRITGSIDYVFKVDANASGTFGWAEFAGIAFYATGIEIQANRRGMTKVHKCTFVDAPAPAIYGNGISIVGGVIQENKFTGCAGAIKFTGNDVDLLEIKNNAFVRGHTNPDVDLGTLSSLVQFNDFETRAVTSATVPWIRLTRGGNQINNNRFGDEISGVDFAPPRDAIQIGPDTPDSTPVSSVLISENTARGTNGTLSGTSANSFIRLNAPPINVQVLNNFVAEGADYFTALIHEAYIDSIGSGINKAYSNQALGFVITSALRVPIFSHGGLGWDSVRRDRSGGLGRQNLLRQSNDLTQSLWLLTNATVAKNATGPDGVANSANTVTKTSAGSSASVRTQLIGVSENADGYVCAAAWLKAGSLSRLNVYLVNTTDNIVLARNDLVTAASGWRRFEFRWANINPAKNYFLYISTPGDIATDLAATGTFEVAFPVAHNGFYLPDRSIQNIETGGAQHAAPQLNSLILGQRVIGYGTAAPTSGRYEVGDITINTAPAAAGTIGWVCTTAGSPGTWKTWGSIAA